MWYVSNTILHNVFDTIRQTTFSYGNIYLVTLNSSKQEQRLDTSMSNKYKTFKVQIPQELSEDGFDRRVEFCNIRMQRSEDDANFINNIVFSDELTFMLNRSVNRHNCCYWSDTNPLWMMEGQKLLFGLAFT